MALAGAGVPELRQAVNHTAQAALQAAQAAATAQDYVINTIKEFENSESESDGEKGTEMVTVIVDSGADASLFPGHLMSKVRICKMPKARRYKPMATATWTLS